MFEPLGQKIRTTTPFQEPPPPNPPPILNDSKSPEWQCTLYSMMGITEAKELPANCSIAAAERSIWERSPISPKQKGNPSKINPVDSPIPGDGPYSAGGQTLAYALGAARKRGPSDDGEDDSKKPVQDIGQFDGGTIYASDDLEAIAPELDSSFVDASQVGGPNPRSTPPVGNSQPQEGVGQDDGIDCGNELLTEVLVADASSNPNDRNKKNIPYINSTVYPQFQAALDEINLKIGHIGFSEMFRDFSRQAYLVAQKAAGGNRNPVAAAGTSNHESGFAFDVPGRFRSLKSQSGETVEGIFIKHGFIKIHNDPPHFTWKNSPSGQSNVQLNKQLNAWFLKCTKGY